jgi:hypothetical protein
MAGGRHWIVPVLIVGALAARGDIYAREAPQESGPPFQTVLEIETTARLLAILLDSGRAVINENQERFENAGKAEELTPESFEQQLVEVFRSRSGLDLHDLNGSRLPPDTKKLLPVLVTVSKAVVGQFQPEIYRQGTAFQGLLPAVFGSRVASRFSDLTSVRLKQTSLAPRNPANTPDAFERAALEMFADPSHPREQLISEVNAKSPSLRLMYPLYTTRQCLRCHGEPKGEADKTGYPREGLQLGQNAGAISVVIPLHK